MCCVPQCRNRRTAFISLHSFPKSERARKAWKIKLKIGEKKRVSTHFRVCSEHFVNEDFSDSTVKKRRLKQPELVVPTRNLPRTATDVLLSSPLKQKHQAREERMVQRSRIQLFNTPDPTPDENVPTCPLAQLENEENDIVQLHRLNTSVDKCIQTEINTEDKCTQTPPTFSFLIKTTDHLTCCTGLHSFDLWDALCVGVQKYTSLYCKNFNVGRNLSLNDQLLLTLMKLKLNCTFTFLSMTFKVARVSCSRYFNRMIIILYRILKHYICTPSRESLNDNIPRRFLKYKTCKFILDCTEFPVCSPKCIRCRTQSYSFYKKRHTLKLLVGCSPSGLITYMSPLYGGKASDKHIFNKSNLLDSCEPGDSIMVDKGFHIKGECQERNIKLIQPAFKQRNSSQMNKEDCERTRSVASARVDVERIMERLKNFRILHDEIQYNYLPYMNEIIFVIGSIVNLSPPILKDDSFVYE